MGTLRFARGGAISLLLTLLAIGALLYLLLRTGDGSGAGGKGTDAGKALNCEPLIARLVAQTGGVGPQAQEAYAQLPAPCRKLLPDPAALAPPPEPQIDK